jgi:hypothetical protein
VILLAFLGLVFWAVAFRRRGRGVLDGAIAAFVVWGIAVSLITELQSLTGSLTATGSQVAWTLFAALGAAAARRTGPTPDAPASERPGWEAWGPPVLLLGITAPNSFDGLTYHLVRVERWIQQGSLQPFATHNTRQLFMPPWPAYGVLQFELLSGGDRFANLLQWLGLAGACGGAALLAAALGGGTAAVAGAATLVATLPMAIAQASGTQTDVVAACWAVIGCGYGYRLLQPDSRRGDLWLAAGGVGLAAATKQTAALFVGFALLPALLLLTARGRRRRAGSFLLAGLLSFAVLAGPHLLRTRRVFGNWSGDPYWTTMVVSTARGPAQVTSTLLRNLALHFGTPWEPVNRAVAAGAAGASRAMGADPDDPRTTWWSRFGPVLWNTHEANAPNPLHLLLLIGCAIGLWRAKLRDPRLGFALALGASFVAFSALFKWQPYNSRLHTPLFVLGLAWAAVELEKLPRPGRRAVLLGVTLAALPSALLNYTRPLLVLPGHSVSPSPSIATLPRNLQYFLYWPHLAQPYLDVAVRIAESGCTDVGIRAYPDAWEYPVMALTREAGSQVRFRSVDVTNASARFADTRATPCLLLQIGVDAGTPPAWAAGWKMVADWRPLVGMGGLVLFGPGP